MSNCHRPIFLFLLLLLLHFPGTWDVSDCRQSAETSTATYSQIKATQMFKFREGWLKKNPQTLFWFDCKSVANNNALCENQLFTHYSRAAKQITHSSFLISDTELFCLPFWKFPRPGLLCSWLLTFSPLRMPFPSPSWSDLLAVVYLPTTSFCISDRILIWCLKANTKYANEKLIILHVKSGSLNGKVFHARKAPDKGLLFELVRGNGEARLKAQMILKTPGKKGTCLLYLKNGKMLGFSFLLTCKPERYCGAMKSF